jgi:hypothetical protein
VPPSPHERRRRRRSIEELDRDSVAVEVLIDEDVYCQPEASAARDDRAGTVITEFPVDVRMLEQGMGAGLSSGRASTASRACTSARSSQN